MCVCVCVCVCALCVRVCVYTNQSLRERLEKCSIFNRCEFKAFLLFNLLSYQGKGPSPSIDVQRILVYISFLNKKSNSIVHDLNYVC